MSKMLDTFTGTIVFLLLCIAAWLIGWHLPLVR